MIKNFLPMILAALVLPASAQTSKTKPERISDTTTYMISKSANPFKLIEPGKGVGHLRLNSNVEHFASVMGNPDRQNQTGHLTAITWFEKHDTTANAFTVYTCENTLRSHETVTLVKQVRVTSPQFITIDSLHAGSSLSAIRQVYKLQSPTVTGSQKLYDVPAAGIAFEVDDRNICTAIIVHLPKNEPVVYAGLKP